MNATYVKDVSEATFAQDVIEASMEHLVLVDLWATWCGPCKTLSPLLEKLADEYKGAVLIAKVDVDKEQRIAMQFGVQSVPTVFAFFKGQPVDGFQSALPYADLKRFVDGLIERFGIKTAEPEGPPTEPRAALEYWQRRAADNDQDGEALLNVGRLAVAQGEMDVAAAWFRKIEASMPEYGAARAALATLGLMESVEEAGGEAAVRAQLAATPDDPKLRYLTACADAASGQIVTALETLIDLVRRSNPEVKPLAKAAAATVFEAAGRDNPDVEVLRRKLSRLLF